MKIKPGDLIQIQVYSDFYPVDKNQENWEISVSRLCGMHNKNNFVMVIEIEPCVDSDLRIDGFICMYKFEFWFCPNKSQVTKKITCPQK